MFDLNTKRLAYYNPEGSQMIKHKTLEVEIQEGFAIIGCKKGIIISGQDVTGSNNAWLYDL